MLRPYSYVPVLWNRHLLCDLGLQKIVIIVQQAGQPVTWGAARSNAPQEFKETGLSTLDVRQFNTEDVRNVRNVITIAIL